MRVRVYQEYRSDDAEDSYQTPLDAIDAYLASRPRFSERVEAVAIVVEPLDDEAVMHPYTQWSSDQRGRFALYTARPRVFWEVTRGVGAGGRIGGR